MDNNFLKIIVVVVVTLGAMSFLATMNQPSNDSTPTTIESKNDKN